MKMKTLLVSKIKLMIALIFSIILTSICVWGMIHAKNSPQVSSQQQENLIKH